MQEDLDLQGMDYNIALSVFFVSYALLEVPSNVVLKLMSPRKWIAIIMFAVRYHSCKRGVEDQFS